MEEQLGLSELSVYKLGFTI